MAKKQFGKLLSSPLWRNRLWESPILRYKSFHEELEEDFHDFEDDLDEFDSKERGSLRSEITFP